MNGMISGDSGNSCFSPYHKSSRCLKCKDEDHSIDRKVDAAIATAGAYFDNFNWQLYELILKQRA